MKSLLREKAIRLRCEKELSYSEIKKRLGVPKSTLSYWLQDYPLSKERILELRRRGWSKGETARERYRNTMRQKKQAEARKIYTSERKKFQKLSQNTRYACGLMVYLAEGTKRKNGQISLANTDANIIKFFIQWLSDFFNVSKSDIRVQLHLYESMNIAKEEKFWNNTLGLKSAQFYKPSIRKLKKNSFSYPHSHGHGTCSIYVFDEKKRIRLLMAMKALMEVLNK